MPFWTSLAVLGWLILVFWLADKMCARKTFIASIIVCTTISVAFSDA